VAATPSPAPSTDPIAGMQQDAAATSAAARAAGQASQPYLKTIQDSANQLAGLQKEIDDLAKNKPSLDLKPFQAPTPQDPAKSFVSIGSVLGLMASFATKTPMTAALNAMTAGMNAVKQQNADDFNKAFDTWKANTDLAIKSADFEEKLWGDALQAYQTDITLGESRMRVAGAMLDKVQQTEFLLRGDPKAMFDMHAGMASALAQLKQVAGENEERGIRMSNYFAAIDEWKGSHGGKEPPPEEKMRLANAAMSAAFGSTELRTGAVGGKSAQAVDSLLKDIDSAIELTGSPGASGLGVTGMGGTASRIAEWGSSVIGGTPDTSATAFRSQVELIAQRAQKLLAGGRFSTTAAQEVEDSLASLSEFSSPSSARTGLMTLKNILSSQTSYKEGVEDQVRAAGGYDPVKPKSSLSDDDIRKLIDKNGITGAIQNSTSNDDALAISAYVSKNMHHTASGPHGQKIFYDPFTKTWKPYKG
jgi:hypothetical protein